MSNKPKTLVYVPWEGGGGIFLSADQYDRDSKFIRLIEEGGSYLSQCGPH